MLCNKCGDSIVDTSVLLCRIHNGCLQSGLHKQCIGHRVAL